MPFEQPVSTTIRSFNFRDNQYTFPLESVLKQGQKAGALHIEASPSYLLATLSNPEPQAQLSLEYTSRPDGSYFLQTRITLIASGPLLTDGSVTLRDPAGQVLQLKVLIKTLLTLSDSTLTFTITQLTDTNQVNAVLKINQQGTLTPIDLSTDAPHRFALAVSGKQLHFTPTLTVTPTGSETYIYIRYMPEQEGEHTACLAIKTPYDTQLVTLHGIAGKHANWYQLPWWPNWLTPRLAWLSQPLTIRLHPARICLTLLAGLLLYMGYTYRCQLIPQWCPAQQALQPVITYSDTTVVRTQDYSAAALEERFVNRLKKKDSPTKPLEPQPARLFVEPVPHTGSAVAVKVTSRRIPKIRKQAKVFPPTVIKPARIVLVKPVTVSQESDLERALNQMPRDKSRPQLIELPPIFKIRSQPTTRPGKVVNPLREILIHN